MKTVFALVDCNNFYASCERLFRPELEGKPVVVLSNNDGCIIARSNEAKALGIPMGAPPGLPSTQPRRRLRSQSPPYDASQKPTKTHMLVKLQDAHHVDTMIWMNFHEFRLIS